MKTGTGLALVAIGAILAFAVTANTSFLNLNIAGWVLMIIGAVGLVIPRRGYAWVGRRLFVRQARWRPGNRIEEEAIYPVYANRNPANTRVQAGLPGPGALGSREATAHVESTRDLSTDPASMRPGETEIVEDILLGLTRPALHRGREPYGTT